MTSMAAMVLAIAVAGWQVIEGNLGGPLIFAIFLIAQRIGSYAVKIGRITLSVQQGLAAAGRIFEIVDTEEDVKQAPGALPLPRVTGEVSFDSVSFAYDSSVEVLKDVSLRVKPGEVVALVGPSGAGKTSLVNLIPRFYDPTQGHIRIDGHDLRDVTIDSLRSQIGYVPQDTVLFAGSVYDNVRYGRLDARREEVVAAARAANAEDFIEALPGGYETEVGERGAKLSGGQRQRIAIARTLLKDPRILILDEATSSLDTESEALVQEALERLMAGRTTFVIAHRLSTVRNADRILVLAYGKIVEQGTHQELLAKGGLYRRLYEMQFREQESEPTVAADSQ
jgi:subfamily B ATP-binding cassette protein MsbA